MIQVKDKYFIIVAVLAFCIYQGINFFYFPLDTRFGDENRFIREAILLHTDGVFRNWNDMAWEMPLTAILYSCFYSIFETKESLIVIVRIFQSILLLLQAYLLYKISMKIFNDKLSGFLTFVITLFYPFFIFYQGLLLSENIFITLLIISFYFIYSWYEDDFTLGKYFILSNLFLVATLYSKGTLFILPPFLLAAFYFLNKLKMTTSFKVFIYSIVLYSLFLSPWWIRNYLIFEKFVPLTTSSGMNFYLGNNSSNLTGGCDWLIDVDRNKVREIYNIKDELVRNEEFKTQAMEFIKNNPDRFLELAYLKLKRFYNVFPNAEIYNKGYYKWISFFSYGIIFFLFLISVFIHIKHFKKLSAIYILFLYYTLIHIIIIASLRYRLPLEPFMILLATPVISKIYLRFRIQ